MSKKRNIRDSTQNEPSINNVLPKRASGREAPLPIGPPVILSSTSINAFESISDLDGVVENPSAEIATLSIRSTRDSDSDGVLLREYIIPPHASFVLCTLPLLQPEPLANPIPGLPLSQRFNLILFDPSWPNRSVRRSREYYTHSYNEMDILTQRLKDILRVHAYRRCDDVLFTEESATDTASATAQASDEMQTSSQESFAAIWITNSEKARKVAYEALLGSGFNLYEEWVWIKVTSDGQPVCPVDGVWRKPYEILVIGRMGKDLQPLHDISMAPDSGNLLGVDPATITRRVIAAVPDLHSRKPNLRALFASLLFGSEPSQYDAGPNPECYSAIEVFARNLTAGWLAAGNEVLKFNARECWIESA